MDPITIDGLEEDEFRCSIEAMLREGEADAAAARLRALIEPHAGDGSTLPERFLSVSSADFTIRGWHDLDNRLGKYDRPGHWVSAIGISIVHPSEAESLGGVAASMSPCIETSFYTDDAYPFSKSDRNDLLEGYTRQGAEWQGNFDHADMTLSVTGVEDLFGAIAELEARLLSSEAPADAEICAGSLAACYLSVLLHQAVRDKIRAVGLPRPLSVMTGCVGVYPFFDAPVMSSIECLDGGFFGMDELALAQPGRKQEAVAKESASDETYGSLLSLTPRAKKKMVMELDAEESAAATRQFEMASAHQLAEADEAPPRTGGTDFSSYAFDDEPPAGDGRDDWADIPESPLFGDSQFEHEMDDWFGRERAPDLGEEEIAFPVSDVSGWDTEEPVGEPAGHALEPMPDEQPSDMDFKDVDKPIAAFDAPHPDEACYISPPPPAGHGLRAKLAMTAEPQAAQTEGLFALLRRLLGKFTRGWS